jgi:sortase A
VARNLSRKLGLLLVVAGAAALVWTLLVWQWRDPFTSIYTALEQRKLAVRYEALAGSGRPAGAKDLASVARRFRLGAHPGDPIGRLEIPRLGLDIMVVNGTDAATLKKGPARDERSFMPGEGELVYIAGHRTTYLAPFARIDDLRRGDRISLETPYGAFEYEVERHRIVADDDLSVLRSPGREALRLQACHPRFFATHRYVVFARPVEGAIA